VTVPSTGRTTDQTTLAPRVSIDASERAIAQDGRLDVSVHNRIGALYRFTDRLFRARSRSDACDAALDAIREALGYQRASILLFDDSGSMRFIAWRGLSDGYRRAVDGHSPWTRDTEDPLPICIENIDSADLDDALKATIKAEGIRALAFVPLFAKGELVGKFMTYCDTPRAFTDAEINLAVTIARQLGFSLERMRAAEALIEAQAQLVSELAATQQLHKISTQLIQENEAEALHEKVLDAAMAIMRSDFASMQLFHPERGELRLLAYRGFNPAAAAFWEWVRPASGSTCGVALATRDRSMVADVELSDVMRGSEDLETYRQTGIRAVQSTPLISRTGCMLGMISTHWSQVHQPREHDLRLLDVLARQAADLIERTEAEQVAQRLSAIVGSSYDAIVSKDLNGIITSWNNGAERLFGYRAEEAIGKPILILIPADHPNEEPNILDRIRRGERVDPYETVRRRKDGSLVEILLTVSPVKDVYSRVVGASKIAHDISERKRAEKLLRTVMHELSHRSKNLLSVIQAMAQQTARLSPSVDAFLDRFIGRVQGLAASQDLLVNQNWTGVSLDELVRQQLQPFGGRDAGRIEADGPPLYVAPDAAQTLGLALHELATNASKYGALSVPGGSVAVQWKIEPGSGTPRFRMSWRERGGPSVETTERSGFGRMLIERLTADKLNATILLTFAREGVVWTLDAAARDVLSDLNQGSRH
jgi:PAS domain S-box-containing protein